MSTIRRIDGSYGEGGGQILRTAVTLSAMTGDSVEISNIRANRSKPGLQPQHLSAVRAAAALCRAKLSGDAVGSRQLLFHPCVRPQAGEYRFDIGTAGAATLLAQTVLLPLALATNASRVILTGGTHVPMAPMAEYLENIYVPLLTRAGLAVRLHTPRLGFYPRGGGEIALEIAPVSMVQPLQLPTRGTLRRLQAIIVTANLPSHVAERGATTTTRLLRKHGLPAQIVCRDLPSNGAGAAIVICAQCAGGTGAGSGLGAPGKPMEQVAEEAVTDFLTWWQTETACDEHLADQLVLPMAWASGVSRWSFPRVTEHLRTVIWLTQQFLPIHVAVDESSDAKCSITLTGIH